MPPDSKTVALRRATVVAPAAAPGVQFRNLWYRQSHSINIAHTAMTLDFRASSQLLGSYLHQGWVKKFDTEAAAVQAMIESEPGEVLAAASNEIRDLLSFGLSDTALGIIMTHDVGCYFDPKSKHKTYREWLGEVAERLETKAG